MARHDSGPEELATDANPFAPVVAAHWDAVYRLLYTLSGNTHDTEDLTQETFLRALSRLSSFAPGTNMRAWLLRIASNAFFDVRRKRQRARVESLSADLPGTATPPEHLLELAEQGEVLKVALEELSETARLVFHLRAVEDLPFREVAAILGSTEEAARWHMHQARTRLLKRLAHLKG
ncbi:MAG TPA: sigma-70 family RNA polymerase sigma factor [Gemmataceae bacterium]|nr:sigma-70 family RNA polymerase sigma factor [Gemmataceae bacterium]